MNILVGMVKEINTKKGSRLRILHLLEENSLNTDNEVGQLTNVVMLDLDELEEGSIQVEGSMEVGCYIRVMKENKGGLDRVSYIVCTPRKGK